MCFKMCKKCCETLFIAAVVGGVICYLKSKNDDGEEMGCVIADCLKKKKDRFMGACGCMKDQTIDMASEAKNAASASAEDVRDGLKNSAGEIRDEFRHAADNIRRDMGEMKRTADSMFDSGENE